MKLIDKTTYTTTTITVEHGDEEYVITHSDLNIVDAWTPEWWITDSDNNVIESGPVYDKLKLFAKDVLEDQGPEYDSAGFSIEDR